MAGFLEYEVNDWFDAKNSPRQCNLIDGMHVYLRSFDYLIVNKKR